MRSERLWLKVNQHRPSRAAALSGRTLLSEVSGKGGTMRQKQVMPIVVREEGKPVVVTVYVFYFGG
jgi:hypothetical protein